MHSPKVRKYVGFRLLTGTPSTWDSWSAFFWRRQSPALVTNTTGTKNWPWELTSFWKAVFAAGIGVFPRTSTPSMSKRNPKDGCTFSCEKEQKSRSTLIVHTHIFDKKYSTWSSVKTHTSTGKEWIFYCALLNVSYRHVLQHYSLLLLIHRPMSSAQSVWFQRPEQTEVRW